MHALAKRLRSRMDFLGLGVDETAARVGVKYKTFSRYITGTAKQNLHPDVFVRLCAVLAVTPNQAFGLAPMAGVDEGEPADPAARALERARAGLGALDANGVRVAAALVDALARSRAA